jgi:hypothetical protein
MVACLSEAIYARDLRMRAFEVEHVVHPESRLGRIKVFEHLRDEDEVGGLIDRPAQVREVHIVLHLAQCEALRLRVDERRDVLALGGLAGFARCLLQHFVAHALHIEAVGVGGMQGVRGVIDAGLLRGVDHLVDDLRIGERAIACEAHDIRRLETFGRTDEAIEHVVQAAAMAAYADAFAQGLQCIVARIGAGRYDQIVDAPGTPHAFDLVREQRLATDAQQHLAGQAGRAHARLQDGERGAGGRRHARGFQSRGSVKPVLSTPHADQSTASMLRHALSNWVSSPVLDTPTTAVENAACDLKKPKQAACGETPCFAHSAWNSSNQ